jgi:hypothetical protein
LKEKLEEKDSRMKMVEEEYRKKISLKDKKSQETESKLVETKEEMIKIKTQYEINTEKLK